MPENLHKHMQIDGFNVVKVIKAGMYGDLAVLNDLPIRGNRLHHSQPGWITDEWRNTLSIYILSKKIKGTIWKHIRSHDNVTNERGAYCLMEIKMVSLQRAKFNDISKPKVKKKCFTLVLCLEISLQPLIMVLSSLYGPHTFVCMTDNIGALA